MTYDNTLQPTMKLLPVQVLPVLFFLSVQAVHLAPPPDTKSSKSHEIWKQILDHQTTMNLRLMAPSTCGSTSD